ncbi:MAG: hypothetical protein QW689_07215 [Nitrososphaerota archaeon]
MQISYDKNKVPLWRWTGVLISERILLTAGHCTACDPELCFGGDSGGQVPHKTDDGEELIAAVNSFVLNQYCKGSAFAYRTDIPDSLDFLEGFGVTP